MEVEFYYALKKSRGMMAERLRQRVGGNRENHSHQPPVPARFSHTTEWPKTASMLVLINGS